MSAAHIRYGVPGIFGAAIAFATRFLLAGLGAAVIGVIVFAICYITILLLAHRLDWQDAPTLYAAVSALAATVAFLVSGEQA